MQSSAKNDNVFDLLSFTSPERDASGKQEGEELQENKYQQLLLSSAGKEKVINITLAKQQIKNYFFGIKRQAISYKNENNVEQISEQDFLFGPIFLDLNYKDLYSSWEAQNKCTIEEYLVEKSTVTAKKEYWIVNSPKILFFQVQRVIYDKEKGSNKINDKFFFDKEIFIDRFLLQNKPIIVKNEGLLTQLKKQKQDFEQQLKIYQNFDQTGLNIVQILSSACKFLKEKEEDLLGSGNEKDQAIVNSLSQNIEEVKSKIKQLEASIQSINTKLDELFVNQDLKKHKYILHSILIHVGQAQSGHYYSYVYDYLQKKWRKFSDIHVSEETEEKVFEEAYGVGNTSAYCLIYIEEAVIRNSYHNSF